MPVGGPYAGFLQPTFDMVPAAVPTSLTSVTASVVMLIGLTLTNVGTIERKVSITNTAGTVYLFFEMAVSPGVPICIPIPYKLMTGVKWIADGAGIQGAVWGYL